MADKLTVAKFVAELGTAVQQRPGRWVGWVKITPAMAATWLERFNVSNRMIRPTRVARYAADALDGKWIETGEPMILDEDFTILSAQHRLKMIVQSGKAVVSLVVLGVPREAKYFVDQGIPKMLADFFRMDGVECFKLVATACSYKAAYDRGIVNVASARAALSTNVRRAVLEDHAGLVECVARLNEVPPGMGGRALWAWLLYEFSAKDAELAEKFVEQVLLGVDVKRNSNAFILRRKLGQGAWTSPPKRGTSAKKGHPRGDYMAAVIIKAWNAERGGTVCGALKWLVTESFPVIA